jgi:hypothetical protein
VRYRKFAHLLLLPLALHLGFAIESLPPPTTQF